MIGIDKNGARAGYGCEDVNPQGFVSLMDLYENNYLRIRKLIPNLAELGDDSVSQLSGCLSLHLSILERSKFTTTFTLTYLFSEGEQVLAEPALTVRIYHDANIAEVLTGHLHHGRLRYDRIPKDAIKVKWQLNRFLFKWLGYCLHLGHAFQPEADSNAHTASLTLLK